jgi:hypothetical protein
MTFANPADPPAAVSTRSLRICLYGGTDLDGVPQAFVRSVAEELLVNLPAVVVTGGFLRRNDKPAAVSTDAAALDGARRASKRKNVALRTLFEAYLPDHHLDGRPDVGGVVRMGPDLGITIRTAGRTSLGRRLTMVGSVDLVITFAGKVHTEVVLEQALELSIPALPIRHTGGESEKIYDLYRDRIESSFAPGEVRRCFAALDNLGLQDPGAVRAVLDLVRTAKVGRCLVLQPYRTDDDALYEEVIRPAVEQEMTAVRLKDAANSKQIYISFFEAASGSTTVVADITELNENVMYEVGYVHALGLHPLLFTLDPARVQYLPVYLRTLNVHVVTRDQLARLVTEHLRDAKRHRGASLS